MKSPTNTQNNMCDLLKIERKNTIVETIAEKLILYIATNKLTEGSKLPSERELTEIIGISRLPLREAICMLKGLGIVEAYHGKGIFVKNINLSEIFKMLSPLLKTQRDITLNHIIDVRLHIEPIIAQLAANNRTDENLKALKNSIAGMEEYINNLEQFINYDMKFHTELAESTQNKLFTLFVSSITSLLKEVQYTYPDTPKHREISLEYHKKIFNAIKRKYHTSAYKWMKQHIEAVRSQVCQNTKS